MKIRKIKGLIGYTISNVDWDELDVIAYVNTGGSDGTGFTEHEIIGVAKDETGSICIFKGSDAPYSGYECPTVWLSDDTTMSLPAILRKLADKIEKS